MYKKNRLYPRIICYLFVLTLAVGTWNPLTYSAGSTFHDSDERSIINVLVQIIFIIYLSIFIRTNRKIKKSLWYQSLIAFFFISVFTSILISITDLKIQNFIYITQFLFCTIVIIKLPTFYLKEPELLNNCLKLFVFTCCVLSILFCSGFLNDYVIISKGRAIIFGENPNTTGCRYVLSILFLVHIVFKDNNLNKLYLALAIPMMIVVFAGGSRGNFLILCFCLALYTFLYRVSNPIRKYLFIFCAVLISATILMNTINSEEFSLFSRLEKTINRGDDGGRKPLEDMSLSIFNDYPIFGSGYFKQKAEMLSRFNEERSVHNMFIYILSCTGIVGSLFFTLFYVYWGIKAYTVRKKNPFPLVLYCFTTLLVYKTGGVFLFILWWFIFALIRTEISLYTIQKSHYDNSLYLKS